ncbi:hypothetical protein [Streptomyces anulatus]|uniref:hypothetical protein n=1 Tax=Streptomyces anulatus TaxID=1892 RepID=UPI003865CE21
MTTVPIAAVRQALDDTEAALARLRPALADAYGTAGENLTRAAGQLDVAERARAAAERRAEKAERDAGIYRDRLNRLIACPSADEDAERFKADHEAACRTIAEMHEAATGRTGMGPIRGVVEDVADVRARAEKAEKALAAAEHRIGILNAVDAGRAHGAQRIMAERDQAQRDAKEAKERARVAHVAAYRVQQQTPAAAQRTLDRIRNARTGVEAWTELGMYFGMTPEQAGQRARDWRVTAVRVAEERAETASVLGARYMGDSERFHAAWHSARLRAQRTASELRVTRASRRRWKRRTRTAEQLLAAVRQYLAAAYADDIAPGVRDDLALILDGRAAEYAPVEGQ